MFYQKTAETVIKEFQTNAISGLTTSEASKRLSKYGPNLLPTQKKPPLIFKFFEQFKNILVVILLIAAIISGLVGDIIDTVAIAVIVIINATIGFVQEAQAEKTLESLKQKEATYALVIRNGVVEKISDAEVVPGDILILEEGAKIPADTRIIESYSLRIDESILTGESAPASKNPQKLASENLSLNDRLNMVYKETKVITGRGKGVGVATGCETEIGKIASYLQKASPIKTPLTLELEKVSLILTIIILIVAASIFILNIVKEITFIESLLISISLSVAAIPEGLPAVVTIILSLGMKRLAQKKSIIKKMMACETLGAVRIIATDKTGTLTQNKINVVEISLSGGAQFFVKGEGYQPTGTFFDKKEKIINPRKIAPLETLLRIGVLASNATITDRAESEKTAVIGDTTEGALLVAARRAGINIEEVRRVDKRIYEIPFSSERKLMSVAVEVNETNDHMLYAKGAPEVILAKCNITPKEKEKILGDVKNAALSGLRSLSIAQRKLSMNEVKHALEEDTLSENNLTFLGLYLMQDPLRREVREALANAKKAGIRTIMITGDHKETAYAIAKEAGILEENVKVLTEDEITGLSKKKLALEIKNGTNVFARISPMGKLKIIEAIKSIPHMLVAVTGDGVNDAPALKAAHIGIAMGQTGTDITREVADMVITDDNYATIVDAIEEGRIIFANLVKFIRYLISCNLSEVIVVALAVFFAIPLPLLPIQLLWINLITDGLPALALGVDPPEFDIMKKPPRDLSISILHKIRLIYMMIEGMIMGVSVFAIYLLSLSKFSYGEAQTITFTTLAFCQLVHAFNNRSTRKSLFEIGIFGNKILVLAVIFSVFLQILVVQTNWGNLIFKTQTLNFYSWLMIIFASFIPFLVVEIKKQLRFKILP